MGDKRIDVPPSGGSPRLLPTIWRLWVCFAVVVFVPEVGVTQICTFPPPSFLLPQLTSTQLQPANWRYVSCSEPACRCPGTGCPSGSPCGAGTEQNPWKSFQAASVSVSSSRKVVFNLPTDLHGICQVDGGDVILEANRNIIWDGNGTILQPRTRSGNNAIQLKGGSDQNSGRILIENFRIGNNGSMKFDGGIVIGAQNPVRLLSDVTIRNVEVGELQLDGKCGPNEAIPISGTREAAFEVNYLATGSARICFEDTQARCSEKNGYMVRVPASQGRVDHVQFRGAVALHNREDGFAVAHSTQTLGATTAGVGPLVHPITNWANKSRWGIEEFHRTLKSGCRIEDRQLQDATSLQSCLALDLVVAWRIEHMKKRSREEPDLPCTVSFTEAERQVLTAKFKPAALPTTATARGAPSGFARHVHQLLPCEHGHPA